MPHAMTWFIAAAFLLASPWLIRHIYTRQVRRDIRCPHCGASQTFIWQMKKEIANGGPDFTLPCAECHRSFRLKKIRLSAIGADPEYLIEKLS